MTTTPTAPARTLHRTSAQSASQPGRVWVDGGEQTLPVAAPPALGGADADPAWHPEQLYAAAVASCLHQTLGIVASEVRGADLTDSRVTADVALTHDGSLHYGFTTRVTVEVPRVDAATRRMLLRETLRVCPIADQVELADA
ncbi:OsmC family protein [Streptomyces sp. JJ66]|uniref:OsmC family protein n=1 Tax=Streptomyces sp. JJ66 TaxID=2803843 RepID=UPI001C5A482E|nr:OsmC family protein [Streptomyces sp. JJ66]MBW1604209.1 OsmC family protein [Streptomyces sp. JJ66]